MASSTPKVVCVLGSYGEFVGYYIARSALTRENVTTKILVRRGYDSDPEKKRKVDELVSNGAVIVFGDAGDQSSLNAAFEGVDVVISALGGWGPVDEYHNNVYAACLSQGVKRIVPAQFGVDILSLPPDEMDDYMRKKRAWNLAAISSGLNYTIVSQGAFSQWLLTMPNNPFIHHDSRTVDYCEDPDVPGFITTTVEDTARFTVDVALDPAMENKRVSITGSRLSATNIARIFSAISGVNYTPNCVGSFNDIEAARQTQLAKEKAFNYYILYNWAKGAFTAGFSAPNLIDVPSQYGWTPETFEAAAARLLPNALAKLETAGSV